jgi:hypothetical protein
LSFVFCLFVSSSLVPYLIYIGRAFTAGPTRYRAIRVFVADEIKDMQAPPSSSAYQAKNKALTERHSACS